MLNYSDPAVWREFLCNEGLDHIEAAPPPITLFQGLSPKRVQSALRNYVSKHDWAEQADQLAIQGSLHTLARL